MNELNCQSYLTKRGHTKQNANWFVFNIISFIFVQMQIKKHISWLLILVYSIVLAHNIITHHHHDPHSDNTCYHKHEQHHHKKPHDVHDQNLICFHHHDNNEDCNGACHFLVNVFKNNILTSVFINASENFISHIMINEKDCFKKTEISITIKRYYSSVSLRAPPYS